MRPVTGSASITQLLREWSDGDDAALAALVPLVESELRRLAAAYMGRERPGHTLQPTALVNETFIRLLDAQRVPWQDRGHFLGVAARLMRRVLVDHARTRGRQKRGGDHEVIPLNDAMIAAPRLDFNLLALDRALEALAAVDERKARIIEMRFFGGLTVDETASALSVSADTVKRDWRLAKMWLLRQLDGDRGE
ncbi:RNA polymerase sigma factor [Luteitalea pratensis]|uniref:RNA polymerase sigma factor n=1 Tax=Luteitalea pratensis TaxID=1855912 RepID=A0A143PM54_LUTPR|nr:sigma-70 family RNA polymerase sigma factor [Luteitalea pratensis]AMY09516.1 RNA polymerase sigma factor [Luteitalea pratensis]